MVAEIILKVEKLSAYYGTTMVLDKISFSIQRTGITGLIGPNGAGKTTLLKAILGLVNADGLIIFNGKPIFNNYIRSKNLDTIRSEIGYLPEHTTYYKHLSCSEFLQFIGNLLNYPRELTDNKITHLLEYFNLNKWADRNVQDLSKGNLQRLSLAVTFMQEPKLLLLDEPMSGLAPGGRKQLLELIQRYASKGIPELGIMKPGAVLFSSHILNELEEICERFILLDIDGSLIWEGAKRQIPITEEVETIEELYLQRIRE